MTSEQILKRAIDIATNFKDIGTSDITSRCRKPHGIVLNIQQNVPDHHGMTVSYGGVLCKITCMQGS